MSIPQEKVAALKKKAAEIRRDIITMLSCSKSGHPGGSLSSVEILTSLYFSVMSHDPSMKDELRDRFHLSKGHGCPVWYAVLANCGYFDKSHFCQLRKLGGLLQGHPSTDIPGVECSSGSLGQGLSVATGMALAGKLDAKQGRVYCVMGDGELQEGGIWEAAMSAAHYKLDNLCGIVDHNGLQIDGKVKDVMNVSPIDKKFEAFGWHAIVVDGHDIGQLLEAFEKAKLVKGCPTVIVAHTVKGKGVSFMEHNVNFHGVTPNADETVKALAEIGAA